jgi:transcriptional regulator with XRE-family HTH domain
MANNDQDMTLERYAREYADDPEFIAEGLAIKVTEEMLENLEQKGLNQSWLAERMGVSRALVSRILNAPPNMTLLTIARIAVALELTPNVSLDVTPQRPAPVGRLAASVSECPGGEYKEREPRRGRT